MRSPWVPSLLAMMLTVPGIAQGDPAGKQPATQSTEAAGDVVERLVDPDPSLRHRALAAVLQHPENFRSTAARLHALLAAPPDDSVLRALDAIAGFTDLPLPEALQLLASTTQIDVERALRVLPTFGAELLPHLDSMLAKVDARFTTWLAPVFAAAAAHDPGAVQATLEAAMVQAPGERQLSLFHLLEAAGVSPDRRRQHLVRLLGTRDTGDVRQRCIQLAKDDPSFRAALAEVCAEGPATAANQALEVFGALGPLAAEHWPQLEPCLRSARLVHQAMKVALALRTERPEAVMAVVAAVPSASRNSVATLALALRQCPEWARESVPALAARLPLAFPPHSAVVLESLFVLGGYNEIRRVLPALIAEKEPAVRVQASLFAAAIGSPDEATHERLKALAADKDATVRDAARLAQRLLAGTVDDVETTDHLRDRDPHRVLAAWCTLRARTPAFSEVEAVGTTTLLGHYSFTSFVERELLRDVDAQRLTPKRCASLLAPHRLRDAAFAALWRRSAGGAEVLALLGAPPPPQASSRERLEEIAAKNPELREKLVKAGALPAEPQPLTPGAVAAIARQQELLRQLGDADPARRSAACDELRREFSQAWREQATRLRRSGNAAERRCAAALLETMSVREASLAVEAPEVFVVVRGLETLLAALPHDATAAIPARRALRPLASRPDVWAELARSGSAAMALRLAASSGADAVPCVRAAFAAPAVRSHVLHVLPLLGTEARSFLPEVLRALRTADAGIAACALLVMSFAPDDPEWSRVREAIEAAWSTADPPGKQQLLPAMLALGEQATFASDQDSMLRDGLQRHVGLQLETTHALHEWLRLALQSDASVQRHIATLVLATAAVGRPLRLMLQDGNAVDEVWRRAAELPALRAAMQRAVAKAPAGELKELYGHVLDAAAKDTPLPATGLLLAARPELVEQLLQEGRAAHMSATLARELAANVPDVLLRAVAHLQVPEIALHRLPPLRTEGLVATLVSLLADPGCRNPAALSRLLVAAGEPARDAVLAQLRGEAPRDEPMRLAIEMAGANAEYLVSSLRRGMVVDDATMLNLVALLGAKGVAAVIQVLGVEAALPYVERAATRGDIATRLAALRSLFAIDRERAVPLARQAALAADPALRRWASLMLLPIEDPFADPALLLSLLRDEEPLLRRRALAALAAERPWSAPFAALATDLLADPDAGMRAAAVEAFRRSPDEVNLSRIALQEARAAATTPALAAAIDALLAR